MANRTEWWRCGETWYQYEGSDEFTQEILERLPADFGDYRFVSVHCSSLKIPHELHIFTPDKSEYAELLEWRCHWHTQMGMVYGEWKSCRWWREDWLGSVKEPKFEPASQLEYQYDLETGRSKGFSEWSHEYRLELFDDSPFFKINKKWLVRWLAYGRNEHYMCTVDFLNSLTTAGVTDGIHA